MRVLILAGGQDVLMHPVTGSHVGDAASASVTGVVQISPSAVLTGRHCGAHGEAGNTVLGVAVCRVIVGVLFLRDRTDGSGVTVRRFGNTTHFSLVQNEDVSPLAIG